MSRLLEATCVAGVVTADGLPVTGATVLSEGVASSSGFLVIEKDGKYYVAKTSPDLKTSLEAIASALGQIASALTLLDAKPIGTLPAAPAAASAIIEITTLQTQLSTLKEALK